MIPVLGFCFLLFLGGFIGLCLRKLIGFEAFVATALGAMLLLVLFAVVILVTLGSQVSAQVR